MNTIGFCDSLNELLGRSSIFIELTIVVIRTSSKGSYDLKIIDGAENDTRIIGTIALIVMVLICAVGMDWESKAQNILIAIILAAIFNFLIGTLIGPRDEISQAQGFVGFNGHKTLDPIFDSVKGNTTIFSVFLQFFSPV